MVPILVALAMAGCAGPAGTTDYTADDVEALRGAVESVDGAPFHTAIAAHWDDFPRAAGAQRRPFAVAYTSGQPSRHDAEDAVARRCARLSGTACRLVFVDGAPLGWGTGLRSLFGRVGDPRVQHAVAEIDTRSFEQRSAFAEWDARARAAWAEREAEQARARAADETEMAERRAADDAYNQAQWAREARTGTRQAALRPALPASEAGDGPPAEEHVWRSGAAVSPGYGGYRGGGGGYRGYGGGGCGSRGGPGYRLPSGRCASWR